MIACKVATLGFPTSGRITPMNDGDKRKFAVAFLRCGCKSCTRERGVPRNYRRALDAARVNGHKEEK